MIATINVWSKLNAIIASCRCCCSLTQSDTAHAFSLNSTSHPPKKKSSDLRKSHGCLFWKWMGLNPPKPTRDPATGDSCHWHGVTHVSDACDLFIYLFYLHSADEDIDSTYPTNVVLSSNGDCLWVPPGLFLSTCKINIAWFPFDDQRCDLKFGSWTYDSSGIDLQLHSAEGDTSSFISNGEWVLIGNSDWKSPYREEILYFKRWRLWSQLVHPGLRLWVMNLTLEIPKRSIWPPRFFRFFSETPWNFSTKIGNLRGFNLGFFDGWINVGGRPYPTLRGKRKKPYTRFFFYRFRYKNLLKFIFLK